METIKAPNNSTWQKNNNPDEEDIEIIWENKETGDEVKIRALEVKEETIPESGWLGTGGATTHRKGNFQTEYPDGTKYDGYNDPNSAHETVKMWLEKYPDENGEYGNL